VSTRRPVAVRNLPFSVRKRPQEVLLGGQVALRFVLSNPDVSCAIIGSAEFAHVDEALQAAVLARLDALYQSDFGCK